MLWFFRSVGLCMCFSSNDSFRQSLGFTTCVRLYILTTETCCEKKALTRPKKDKKNLQSYVLFVFFRWIQKQRKGKEAQQIQEVLGVKPSEKWKEKISQLRSADGGKVFFFFTFFWRRCKKKSDFFYVNRDSWCLHDVWALLAVLHVDRVRGSSSSKVSLTVYWTGLDGLMKWVKRSCKCR